MAAEKSVGANRGFEYRGRVPSSAAGDSVLGYLAARYTHSSEAAWRERIGRGQVVLDGRPATADEALRPGQRLSWRRPPWVEPPAPLSFAVLYRDAHLLAVAKPRGLPTLPGGGFLEHTLLHRVRRTWPAAAPLHRLGRGTSGLTLFALSERARRSVSTAWRERRVDKVYRALVQGSPERDEFSVEAAIGPRPHPLLGSVHAADPGGRASLSHVRVLARRGGASLVAVRIVTGRPHQIRIHLAVAGHPLVADPVYAAGGGVRPDAGLPGETGYWLHSHSLGLAHPDTGSRLALECPPPPLLR